MFYEYFAKQFNLYKPTPKMLFKVNQQISKKNLTLLKKQWL